MKKLIVVLLLSFSPMPAFAFNHCFLIVTQTMTMGFAKIQDVSYCDGNWVNHQPINEKNSSVEGEMSGFINKFLSSSNPQLRLLQCNPKEKPEASKTVMTCILVPVVR